MLEVLAAGLRAHRAGQGAARERGHPAPLAARRPHPRGDGAGAAVRRRARRRHRHRVGVRLAGRRHLRADADLQARLPGGAGRGARGGHALHADQPRWSTCSTSCWTRGSASRERGAAGGRLLRDRAGALRGRAAPRRSFCARAPDAAPPSRPPTTTTSARPAGCGPRCPCTSDRLFLLGHRSARPRRAEPPPLRRAGLVLVGAVGVLAGALLGIAVGLVAGWFEGWPGTRADADWPTSSSPSRTSCSRSR